MHPSHTCLAFLSGLHFLPCADHSPPKENAPSLICVIIGTSQTSSGQLIKDSWVPLYLPVRSHQVMLYLSGCLRPIIQVIVPATEDMEYNSSTAGRSANFYSHYKNQFGNFFFSLFKNIYVHSHCCSPSCLFPTHNSSSHSSSFSLPPKGWFPLPDPRPGSSTLFFFFWGIKSFFHWGLTRQSSAVFFARGLRQAHIWPWLVA